MNSRSTKKLSTMFFATMSALLLVLISQPAKTQVNISNPYDPASLDERFDFIVTVQTKKLQNYMTYSGSTLNPITQLTVNYRETARPATGRIARSVQYEDLWYHDCKAIGCRRYNVFQLGPAEHGIIQFLPSEDTSGAGCAIANATTRLLLDVGLNSSALAAVVVPADAVNDVITQFEQFNFHPYVPKPDHGIRAAMSLYICSDPAGVKQYLYYDGSQL